MDSNKIADAKQEKNQFIKKWNINKIKNMTKEEYTSLGGNLRTDFTYDLEHNTPHIGSIKGGDSSKFKLYKTDKKPTKKHILYDGEYAWFNDLGNNSDEAFKKIKDEILNIIKYAQNKDFDKIEKLNIFGDSVKWKIAFLYADEGTLVDIFRKDILQKLSNKKTIYEIQKDLIKQKPENKSIYEYSNELWQEVKSNTNSVSDDIKSIDKKLEQKNTKPQPLNQILYGPPGTGKTYKTIETALEIIFEKEDAKKEFEFKIKDKNKEEKSVKKSYDEILKLGEDEKRGYLKGLFDYFKEQGQIEFVTFHQSYGYEEFVEGIKAKTTKNGIAYEVEPGIFKSLCEQAKTIKAKKEKMYDFDDKVNIWKMSLGDSQNSEEEYLFDYCIKNNKILLGFGDGINFKECSNRNEIANKLDDTKKYSYPPTAINIFKNKMKIGDIVLISYGNRKLRGIGKVKGEYECLKDENLGTYVQSREVEWLLVPDEPFSYERLLKKQFSQMTIYDIKNNVKLEALKELLTTEAKDLKSDKNYILIIDEINRGNISKVFGELITLIEPDKRIGANEELRVKLPYSGEEFGVPKNLYIIGTMNTADRSIALMDTALRRRFNFVEMMPNPKLLNGIVIDGIKIESILETINRRIEYLYDRDHTIGHAYFMSLKEKNSKDELDNIFRNKIIPLLQEYFYDDWEKIQIVLGDHPKQFENKKIKEKFDQYQFIQNRKLQENDIIGFDHPDIENDGMEYMINDNFSKEAYIKIYGYYP